MPPDYSGGAARAMLLLRTLCGLIARSDVAPPEAADRPALLDLARAHRVERIAARAIRGRGDQIDTWFGHHPEALFDERSCAVLDMARFCELRTVLDRLAHTPGISPVVFKGAALAHSHYPDPWLRPRLDTDVLISPQHVAPALAVFEALGYERAVGTSGALVSSQMAVSRVDAFGIDHTFDLHWRIANPQVIASVLTHEGVARRAVQLPSAGPHARAASDVDALLIACLHRAAHHRDCEELLWIYDIHLIAERLSPDNWASFAAAASEGRVRGLCRRGLTLAVDRFASQVPDGILQALEVERGECEPSSVYLSKTLRLVEILKSDLKVLPARERLRLLREHLFPPATYIRQRYRVTSTTAVACCYVRRIVGGFPKWLAARSDS
jgi:hypothetical protein